MQKDHFEQLEQKEMRIQAEAAEEETLRFVQNVIYHLFYLFLGNKCLPNSPKMIVSSWWTHKNDEWR